MFTLWRRSLLLLVVAFLTASPAHSASDAVGALEKPEIVAAYPQPSGVFTPLFVASEAGLFKKYGLNVKLQQLNPQLSVQSVVSARAVALRTSKTVLRQMDRIVDCIRLPLLFVTRRIRRSLRSAL